MKYFAIFLVLAGSLGIALVQQVFAEDSSSFDFAHNLSEDDFDIGRFSDFQYGEKFYQYAYHPFGALSGDSASRCHFTSDFGLHDSFHSESGYVLYKFPNDMIWPGGYNNSTFYVVRSPSSNFPEDSNFEQLTPTKTKDSIILEFDLVSGLNTFVANSTTFWDSQRSQIVDCPNPFDFEKQEYEYYDFVYPLKVQQNYAKIFGLDDDELLCKPERVQVLKIDGSPACVKEQSIPKLIERGWIKNECAHIFDSNMNKYSSHVKEQKEKGVVWTPPTAEGLVSKSDFFREWRDHGCHDTIMDWKQLSENTRFLNGLDLDIRK